MVESKGNENDGIIEDGTTEELDKRVLDDAVDRLVNISGYSNADIEKNNIGLTPEEIKKIRGLAREYFEMEKIGNNSEKERLEKVARKIINTAYNR